MVINMGSERRRIIIENVIYLVLWIMVFTVPVVSIALRTSESTACFAWREVFIIWTAIVPFLVLFLVHNFWFSKYFFLKGKRWLYFVLVVVFLAINPGISIVTRGNVPWGVRPGPPPMERLELEPPGSFRPQSEGDLPQPGNPRHMEPFDMIAISKLALAVLMLALNLVIKWYYKSQQMEEKVRDMEGEMLRGQLQQLRYQINPHFFMNTLNNIHALVDIDPEKAKSTIIELSKLMRYVLYDSSDGVVSVGQEQSFLEKYLSIMRIRYSDRVRISSDFNVEGKEAKVPSLLLVTFLENAFKHGITYTKESVIETSLKIVDDRILFSCYNTKGADDKEQSGGIGLENACKRLDLIYGSGYVLDVEEDSQVYKVTLNLPLTPVPRSNGALFTDLHHKKQ